MKKITKLFLLISATAAQGRVFRKSCLIGLGVLFSCLNISAADYCNFEITSNRGAKAYITCQSLGGSQYEFKFETETAIVDWNKTGSNFYAEVSGIGGTQVSNNLVKTGDKLLTWSVSSTPKPNFYVGVFFVILGDGEHRFDIPTNEDFAAVCSAPEEDTEIPTSFSAASGNVTYNSIELLLNATDNTSTIYYTISYGSGPTGVNTTGVSGVQKSYIITGLTESTSYTFSVVAKDATGNSAANNPILINETTSENTNTECEGTSTEASQGSFTLGYNYKFTTSGTDVTFTCELLDNKDGVVAYAWTYNPNFAETAMTLVSGKKFTKTFTGQTSGASFKVQCKFAYAGGMAVTKTYDYTVGNTCITTENTNPDINTFKMFPNPIQDNLLVRTEKEMREITVRNIMGQTIKTITANDSEKIIDLSELSGGNYIISVVLENGELLTKKLVKL